MIKKTISGDKRQQRKQLCEAAWGKHGSTIVACLDLGDAVATLRLLRLVEPLDADIHRTVPHLPQTDDATDVRHVTSSRDEHRTVTDLRTDNDTEYLHTPDNISQVFS